MAKPWIGGPVGYIVGESSPQEFNFVSHQDLVPARLEYLVVPGVEEGGMAGREKVEVLAQVARIGIDSAVLSPGLTYEETRTILAGEFTPPPQVLVRARSIGYLKDGEVRSPRRAAVPGHPVYIASDEFLSRFFTREVRAGIAIGSLINRPEVEVKLDPNGLRRHLAVIAQTGAGKSYLVGKLLEGLVELGATVIVLDPNSDYVQLRKLAQDQDVPYQAARKTAFADCIQIYRIPGIEGRRYPDEMVGPSKEFTVKFSDLELPEICELARISESYVRARKAVEVAVANLKQRRVDFSPKELVQELARCAEEAKLEGAESARVRMEYLTGYGVWGYEDIAVEGLLKPRSISVFDLAGGESRVMAYVADKTLRELWSRATVGKLPHPVFVVLEEAHNLVPGGHNQSTRASRIINTIASEGRKFRVYLILITQRPSRISEETLSQCGSQFVMQLTNPSDQEAVAKAAEAISRDLLADLPGLNRGEAVVLGQLTRVPVVVKVGKRVSAEGGSDVDLVEELARAREEAEVLKLAERTRPPALSRPLEERWL